MLKFQTTSRPEIDKDKVAQPESSAFGIFALFVAHVFLGYFIRNNSMLATLHAAVILIIALFFALTDKEPYRMIYMMGYIVGAELLWRGAHAQIFWETGKYAVSFFAMVGMLRYKGVRKFKKLPILYFTPLLPSILVMPFFDREAIAFNLMGPFALTISAMFFSVITLNKDQVKRIILVMILPTVSLSAIALIDILEAGQISFLQGSLYATSGNIGPNQVSSMLGLGAFLSILYAILEDKNKFLRFFFMTISLYFFAQSALTFSRGGFWTALLAAFVAAFYLIRERRSRSTLILLSIVGVVIVNFFVFPALDRFTSGNLAKRFASFDSTGRYEIAESDLVIFQRNPIMGVGPGQSNPLHSMFFREANAHTEYTRMLAEHGVLGGLALMILAWMAISQILAKSPPMNKAMAVSFVVWSLIFMTHSATRLVASSFLFGLSFALFKVVQSSNKENVSAI